MLSNIGGLNFEEISNTEAGSIVLLTKKAALRPKRSWSFTWTSLYIKWKRHHLKL